MAFLGTGLLGTGFLGTRLFGHTAFWAHGFLGTFYYNLEAVVTGTDRPFHANPVRSILQQKWPIM